MPISLESNSATMLINQYAHGLAGKALPSPPHLTSPHLLPLSLPFPPPLPPRSISRFAVFPAASCNAIAHPQRTTDRPFRTGPCTEGRLRGAGGGGRALPRLPSHLALSRTIISASGRTPSTIRPPTCISTSFAAHVPLDTEANPNRESSPIRPPLPPFPFV